MSSFQLTDESDNDQDSVLEFERLESTLPPALKDPHPHYWKQFKHPPTPLHNPISQFGNHHAHDESSLRSPQPHHVRENYHASTYQTIPGRTPLATPNLKNSNFRQHLISKLSKLENGRESSPIPLPKPRFNESTFKPALNTKQSSTGVLWVTERAAEYGYDSEHVGDWANLGQGAPEHGDTIPGLFLDPNKSTCQ